MIELRPALNEALRNLVNWRNKYPTQVYPHKIVLNMLYRAYSTRFVYQAYANDEMPEFDDVADIDEMLKDDAPDAPHEKTLEELLETMTPLREDVHPDEEPIVETRNNQQSGPNLWTMRTQRLQVWQPNLLMFKTKFRHSKKVLNAEKLAS